MYGYDKSPCAYVRYHVNQLIKKYESQNRSEILEESWLRSCGQMYDMLNRPLFDFGEFSKNVSNGVMSLLPSELAKEYQNQLDKKTSHGENETFRQKFFKAGSVIDIEVMSQLKLTNFTTLKLLSIKSNDSITEPYLENNFG